MGKLTRTQVLGKVDIQPDGCWIPKNQSRNSSGYHREFHRDVYEVFHGPIPADHELDHRCRNRACCNPAHGRPVSKSYNQHIGYVKRNHQMNRHDLRMARMLHDEVGRNGKVM